MSFLKGKFLRGEEQHFIYPFTIGYTDMENVRNSTLDWFFPKFYHKLRELHQFHNRDKPAWSNCHYNVYNIYIFTCWVILPRLAKYMNKYTYLVTRDYIGNSRQINKYIQAKILPQLKKNYLSSASLAMDIFYIWGYIPFTRVIQYFREWFFDEKRVFTG